MYSYHEANAIFFNASDHANAEGAYEISICSLCNGPHGGVQRPRKVLDVAVVQPGYRYAGGVGHVDVVFR